MRTLRIRPNRLDGLAVSSMPLSALWRWSVVQTHQTPSLSHIFLLIITSRFRHIMQLLAMNHEHENICSCCIPPQIPHVMHTGQKQNNNGNKVFPWLFWELCICKCSPTQCWKKSTLSSINLHEICKWNNNDTIIFPAITMSPVHTKRYKSVSRSYIFIMTLCLVRASSLLAWHSHTNLTHWHQTWLLH